jgi:hypothetical protein
MKEGALIRFLLVALPAGLFVFGVGAMFVSHQRAKTAPTDPNEAVRLEAASLKRGPVDRTDLARSLEMLANRIGERHAAKPESLESAALWFESTIGPANLGYLVERHVFEIGGGREVRNLIAELPGRERRKEIIVVGAHYDTIPGSPGANDNASGIAALVALARTFAGDPQERTIRFVAFANGAGALDETTGSLVYANRCRARGETVVAMLSLDSLGLLPQGGTVSFTGAADAYYFIDSARGAFAKAAGVPASAPSDDSAPAIVGTTDQEAFAKAGYPAVATVVGPPPSVTTSDAVDPDALAAITIGVERILQFWANP